MEKLGADILQTNKTKTISFRSSSGRADRGVFIIRVEAEKLEQEHHAT